MCGFNIQGFAMIEHQTFQSLWFGWKAQETEITGDNPVVNLPPTLNIPVHSTGWLNGQVSKPLKD